MGTGRGGDGRGRGDRVEGLDGFLGCDGRDGRGCVGRGRLGVAGGRNPRFPDPEGRGGVATRPPTAAAGTSVNS
ncbi:MAG: hypothetical protein F6K28_15710 [Microcoleus sp. SIO2G3]|nr:hypothetical protein [Microcoleus sp. SIO2G3]